MPRPKGLHKEDIKAKVRKTGISLRQLSLNAGLKEATVRNALHRAIPTADKAIAECIGKKVHEIWPDRYDAQGNRIKKPRSKRSANTPVRHRKKRLVNLTEEGAV